jgi:hypothetical protein
VGISGQTSQEAPHALASIPAPDIGSAATSDVTDLMFAGPAPSVQFPLALTYGGIVGLNTSFLNGSNGLVSKSDARDDLRLQAQLSCAGCGFLINGDLQFSISSDASPRINIQAQMGTNPTIELTSQTAMPVTAIFNGEAVAGLHVSSIYGVSGSFDAGMVTVPTGVPIRLFMNINGSAHGTANNISGMFSYFDFSHTFGLPLGTPVFNLPPGFTANAPSIGLVDNVFVPEPGTLAMAGLDCVILGGLYRRRRGADKRGQDFVSGLVGVRFEGAQLAGHDGRRGD